MINRVLIVNIITLFAFALIQNSFFSTLFTFYSIPNVILALCLVFVFLEKQNYAVAFALIGGIFLDLFSFSIFGLNTFLLLVAVYLCYFLKQYFFKGWFMQLSCVFIGFTICKLSWQAFAGFTVSSLILGVFLTMLFYILLKYLIKNFVLYEN